MTQQVTRPATTPPVALLRQQLHRLLMLKMNQAGWQTHFTPCVQKMKREFLMRYVGVTSSKFLDAEMCELAITRLKEIAVSTPRHAQHQRITVQQRKAIVKLGRYQLGKVYGDKWFWAQLPVWVKEFWVDVFDEETGTDLSQRFVHRIDDLSVSEARYVIQRMEKIEYQLAREGRL